MFGLPAPKCPVCGIKLRKNVVQKNGKKFCSEEHAQQHEAELKKLSKKLDKECCGLRLDK